MWNRNAAFSGAMVSAIALLGACAETGPVDPPPAEPDAPSIFGGTPPDPANFPGGSDARFAAIAAEVPGFAGYYFDEAGSLTVVMAATDQPMSRGEIGTALAPHLAAVGIDAAAAAALTVREGDYDFVQLAAMHRQVTPVLGIGGVVFTDADEVRNRIVIGVENAAAEAAVADAIAMLDLPAGSVVFERSEPIVMDATLRDHVRPLGGGLQIAWDRFGSTFICTLGFNVGAPARPNVHGFVTNSHCSAVRSEMLNTSYWSPTRTPDNFIGEEVHDLPFFTDAPCPAGRVCRYSDSLGGLYEPGIDQALGIIYRTLFAGTTNNGSLEIDPDNPTWEIVDENVSVVGQTLHKTGRTSGWTMGPVTATCQNTNTSPNITLLCQDRVENQRAGGDSGSPYFERIGETGTVRLAGLHWGGTGFSSVMSSIENIRFENIGPVPWITFPGQTPPQ